MATIEISIPSSAFSAGAVFENMEKNQTQVVIPLRHGNGPWHTIKYGQVATIEDYEFQPDDSQAYQDILQMVEKGMVQFFLVGTGVRTVANLITLFKANYQEL